MKGWMRPNSPLGECGNSIFVLRAPLSSRMNASVCVSGAWASLYFSWVCHRIDEFRICYAIWWASRRVFAFAWACVRRRSRGKHHFGMSFETLLGRLSHTEWSRILVTVWSNWRWCTVFGECTINSRQWISSDTHRIFIFEQWKRQI
jgi:hypothetical protein